MSRRLTAARLYADFLSKEAACCEARADELDATATGLRGQGRVWEADTLTDLARTHRVAAIQDRARFTAVMWRLRCL